MFNANTNSHYKTLKGWTKSAEYSRAKLAEQVEKQQEPQLKDAEGGYYKVKMEDSESWQVMDRPPVKGATEWLFINANGVPLYFWKNGQDGLTII